MVESLYPALFAMGLFALAFFGVAWFLYRDRDSSVPRKDRDVFIAEMAAQRRELMALHRETLGRIAEINDRSIQALVATKFPYAIQFTQPVGAQEQPGSVAVGAFEDQLPWERPQANPKARPEADLFERRLEEERRATSAATEKPMR